MVVRRSVLFSPASSFDKMRHASESAADQVVLDLEDAVSPEAKSPARENVIEAVEELDWEDTYLSVRTNDLATQYAYRDFIVLAESVGEQLDAFVTPKIRRREDVYAIDTFLGQVEAANGIDDPIGLQPLIEVTEGLANVEEIAATSDRLESLIFGPGDFSASIGIDHPSTMREESSPWIWHYPRFRIANAAATNGLDAIDGAFSDFADEDGFRRDCEEARAHGFVGKLAIHPDQVSVANDVFTPSSARVEFYREALRELDEGDARGEGAIDFDGIMLDAAHRKHARRTLELADELDAGPETD